MINRLDRIQNWIELAREAGWSVSRMADQCGVSLRTLERYFLKRMGRSPKVWLAEQRFRRATELLRGGCSIKETAMDIGYKYAHHFSRDFKNYRNSFPRLGVAVNTKRSQSSKGAALELPV